MTRFNFTSRRAGVSALAIVVLLGVGAYAGATAYTGSQTARIQEEQVRMFETKVNATGHARVIGNSYQRGFFSSTQVIELLLGKGGDSEGVPVTITNYIQHGPLPGLRTVGSALVNTEVRFADPAIQSKVDAALGGQQPTIRTLVGLSGDFHTHVLVPKGTFSDQGRSVAWQALEADMRGGGLTSSAQAQWPELKVTMPEGELTLSGLSGSGSVHKQTMDDLLGVGDQTMTLKRLSFTSNTAPTAGNLTLNDINVGAKSTLDDGFYNAAVLYDIGQLALLKQGNPAQNFTNLQLHLSMSHLSREPLARIAKTLNDMDKQAQANPNQPTEFTEAQQKALMGDAVAVLKAQPVLSLDRLSLTQPSGEILLTGKAELPGATELTSESAQMLAAFPLAALGLAKVQAQFKAPEAALTDLLKNLSPDATRYLDTMIQAGMLKRDGNTLVSDLAFASGKATVNGQPLLGGF